MVEQGVLGDLFMRLSTVHILGAGGTITAGQKRPVFFEQRLWETAHGREFSIPFSGGQILIYLEVFDDEVVLF